MEVRDNIVMDWVVTIGTSVTVVEAKTERQAKLRALVRARMAYVKHKPYGGDEVIEINAGTVYTNALNHHKDNYENYLGRRAAAEDDVLDSISVHPATDRELETWEILTRATNVPKGGAKERLRQMELHLT